MELHIKDLNVRIEKIIFCKLLLDKEYRNKALSFLKEKFFDDIKMKVVYKYINKLNEKILTNKISIIMLINEVQENEPWAKDEAELVEFQHFFDDIMMFENNSEGKREYIYNIDTEYALLETEKFAKKRALEKAIMECVNIMSDEKEDTGKKKAVKGDMIKIMSDALSTGIPTQIGLNYNKDYLDRFNKYQNREDKVPFNINPLNEVTFGGFSKKTLSIFMASTGIGKSLMMCSLAADYIKNGNNVLYVTLEMSESKIAARIDANLLDVDIKELYSTSPALLANKFKKLDEKYDGDGGLGKLIVQEFPTSSINTSHIRLLLRELKQKEFFVPDVIFIDYINIMNPFREIGNSNSYNAVKAISEELRGIAVEFNAIMISATQTNRSGLNGVEVGLESVSESTGLSFVCDFFFALYQNETQRKENFIVFKVLKSRDTGYVHKKFNLGVDYSHMRIYELSADKLAEIENTGKDIIDTDTNEDNCLNLGASKRNGKKRK